MFQYLMPFPEKHFSPPDEESLALLCSDSYIQHNQADLCSYVCFEGRDKVGKAFK